MVVHPARGDGGAAGRACPARPDAGRRGRSSSPPIWTWSTRGPRIGSAARSPWSRRMATFFGRGVLDNKTGVTALISTILQAARRQCRPAHHPGLRLHRRRGDDVRHDPAGRRPSLGARTPAMRSTPMPAAACSGRAASRSSICVQGAEKTFASFRLTVTNPGGHSQPAARRQCDLRSGAGPAPGRGNIASRSWPMR